MGTLIPSEKHSRHKAVAGRSGNWCSQSGRELTTGIFTSKEKPPNLLTSEFHGQLVQAKSASGFGSGLGDGCPVV